MLHARPHHDGGKLRQARANPRSARAGFTLVEVLAAFVILALMAVAIQNGVTAAASGIAAARARIGAQAVAASLASGPVAAPAGGSGRTSGNLNGYDWTIDLDLFPQDRFAAGPRSAGNPPWTPARMRMNVRRSGSGPVLATLETIRLVPVAP